MFFLALVLNYLAFDIISECFMAEKGLFIVFEGIDGCGKGTMITRSLDFLFSNFKEFDNIVITREPTHSQAGKQIRKLLETDKDPMTKSKQLLQLYLEDRKEHLDSLIRPIIAKKGIVLCDRYKHSTLTYQQTQGHRLQQLINAHKNMLVPDLTLILDVSVETALKRMEEGRTNFEKFEKKYFMKELRQNYLELPNFLEKENIKIVDAENSKEKVFESVKKEILKILPKH